MKQIKLKNTTKLLILLIAIAGGLLLSRIILSSAFSVDGIALARVQAQIAAIERENMLLAEKLYTASSYATVAQDATSLGFVEEKSQITISGSSPLAIKQ